MSKSTWQKTNISGIDCLIPFDPDSEAKLAKYKPNQPLIGDIHGTRKERSIRQLNTYWKACQIFAENNDDPNLQTKENVDFHIRVELRFYKKNRIKVIGNKVILELHSICFEELEHAETRNYFDPAFELMASGLEVEVEAFLQEVKSRCHTPRINQKEY